MRPQEGLRTRLLLITGNNEATDAGYLAPFIYALPLPEANTTTVRDLTVPSVSSLPLSIMVRSHAFISVELVHRTGICFSTCATLKPVRSI